MRTLLILIAAVFAVPAVAQTIVSSPGPEAVSVTVYRAPDRGPDDAIDRNFPQGYALITETRTVTIPAGATTIRFEGVASGIFAESAIVTGLPDGAREKNLDADLLSPRSLFDRALGRRVMLRRTDRATGKIVEEQAVIRSSKGGGQVLTTAAGVEAVQCSGLAEAIVYDALPAGLTPNPTLSIAVDSPTAATATITLSYLAGGFDWQANYVATMRPDGRSADLIAWLTLVSDDLTSFVGAGTQVIAGKPNRAGGWDNRNQFGGDGGKEYRCWPVGAIRTPSPEPVMPPPPPPPPMMAPMAMEARSMDVIVTGSRIARQEELGDFKLYRVPQPVTVASKAQKQVALLDTPAVPVAVVYVSDASDGSVEAPKLTLRARNRTTEGLGLALPAGQVTVFQPTGSRDILVGESDTDDKAVGEDVEFKLAATPNVQTRLDDQPDGKTRRRYVLTVTNANPWPIAYEAKFWPDPNTRFSADGARLLNRDGRRVWATTVPANGAATLRYRVSRRD